MTRAPKKAAAGNAKAAAITMRRALSNPQLLGGVLGGDSWAAWRVLLTALMGEKLTESERATFRELTGRDCEPLELVDEFWGIIGRRGGKSRAMAALGVYLAAFKNYSSVTVVGERPTVLLLAANVKQAGILLSYVAGVFESVKMLSGMVISRTQDSIELSNEVTIEVRPASFRGIRGITCVACICDEQAFWYNEESGSANPDSEILAALRPALATTGGPLICISSPYGRKGELWTTFDKHFGQKGDKLILVARAPSRTTNPSLPQKVIDRAMERDPAAASSEYLAEFRTDIEAFLSIEAVRGVIMPGVFELPPQPGRQYFGFCDPSGGSSDSMTLGIAFKQDDIAVLACLRETKPPFSPAAVVAEYAQVLHKYGCKEVTGDAYGSGWVEEPFRNLGIRYKQSEKNRSEIYLEGLAAINSKQVSLLDNPKLVQQLVSLERRTSRSGKDSVDHRNGAHDDLANSGMGALIYALASERRRAVLHFGSVSTRSFSQDPNRTRVRDPLAHLRY
jgi:hypothetical protein